MMSQGELNEAARTISMVGGFAKEATVKQVFSSEMAYTYPTPLVHHSFQPNRLYFLSSGQSSSFLGFSTS